MSVTQMGRFSSHSQAVDVQGLQLTSTKLKHGITSLSNVSKQVSGLMVPVCANGCGLSGSGGTFSTHHRSDLIRPRLEPSARTSAERAWTTSKHGASTRRSCTSRTSITTGKVFACWGACREAVAPGRPGGFFFSGQPFFKKFTTDKRHLRCAISRYCARSAVMG